MKISLEAKRKIIEEQIIIDYISFLVYCTLHILSLGYTYKMLIVLTISRSFEPKQYRNNMLNMLERKHCLIKFCYLYAYRLWNRTGRRELWGGGWWAALPRAAKTTFVKEMADFKRFRSPPYFSNVNILYLLPIWYFYLDNMHESWQLYLFVRLVIKMKLFIYRFNE